MRVSILVHSGDPSACHDYAMVWLDPARRLWSRDACDGIALPAEGELVERAGTFLLTDPHAESGAPVTLGHFGFDMQRRQLTAICGAATWFSLSRHARVDGHWQLRAIERSPAMPRPRGASDASDASGAPLALRAAERVPGERGYRRA